LRAGQEEESQNQKDTMKGVLLKVKVVCTFSKKDSYAFTLDFIFQTFYTLFGWIDQKRAESS
jgi:hypothetical protein